MVYRIFHDIDGGAISWSLVWADGDIDKVEVVDDSKDGGDMGPLVFLGRKVKTEYVASKMRPTIARKHFPDYISGYGRCVSDKVRSIIEGFEPGEHQFCPVDIVTKQGKVLAKMYLFFVCTRLDSLHREKTERLWWPWEEGGMWKRRSDLKTSPEFITKHWVVPESADLEDPEWYKKEKLVFDKKKIKGHHVWVEKHLHGSLTYISNALYEALSAANLYEFGGEYFEEG